jgi:hypothetical protein
LVSRLSDAIDTAVGAIGGRGWRGDALSGSPLTQVTRIAVESEAVPRMLAWSAAAAAVAFVAGVATTVLTDPIDWNEQQWGNAAEWVGGLGTAFALFLGLAILARDHGNAERAQVDLVGAWAEPTYDVRQPGDPRVEQAKFGSRYGMPVNYPLRWRNWRTRFTPRG